jgi:hypothetical protein
MEFNVSGNDVRVYEVAEDGSLVAVEETYDSMHLGTGTI